MDNWWLSDDDDEGAEVQVDRSHVSRAAEAAAVPPCATTLDPFTLSLRLLVELTAARRAGDDTGADLLRALLLEAGPSLSGPEQAALLEMSRQMELCWPGREAGAPGVGSGAWVDNGAGGMEWRPG